MSELTLSIDTLIPHVVTASFNLAQAAATYTLLTATNGDIWIEDVQAYVRTAAGGLTSAALQTNHTTPKVVVASLLLAALTLDLQCTIVTPRMVLPSTKIISGSIVGSGNAGLVYVICRWVPITPGAVLA